jgi:threonine dehydrogenase-like Zn-dependent dehydrogenase
MHDRLVEFTAGHGPDVIIEAIGLPETFRAAVEEVAFTGRVVYIGYAKEPVAYETRLFVQKELDIFLGRELPCRRTFTLLSKCLNKADFLSMMWSQRLLVLKKHLRSSPHGAAIRRSFLRS